MAELYKRSAKKNAKKSANENTDEIAGEGSSESFLGRWSRLKQQPQIQTESESTPTALAASEIIDIAEADDVDPAADADPIPLTDADMPPLDSLDESSDFSGFMSEGVSEKLRRKALRKLFHLPEFNIRDGLNEYDEDYSTFIPLGDTVTYQMKQWAERQKQEFEAALAEDDALPSDTCSIEGSDSQAINAVDKRKLTPADSPSSVSQQTKTADEDDEEELGECEEG